MTTRLPVQPAVPAWTAGFVYLIAGEPDGCQALRLERCRQAACELAARLDAAERAVRDFAGWAAGLLAATDADPE